MNPSMRRQDKDLFKTIQSHSSHFSKSHRKVAEYLLNHYQRAVFMTTSQLAETLGLSEPTVVRFAQSLGYSGYAGFLRDLEKIVHSELTGTDRFELWVHGGRKRLLGPQEVISKEIENLRNLWASFPTDDFFKVVKEIQTSQRVYIIGLRGSAHLAQYFGYFLRKVKRPVRMLTVGAATDFDELMEVSSYTLVISIAFPRYPKMTVDLTRYAKQRGAKIVAITDSLVSPIARLSNISLLAPVSLITIFDSYSAPLCLINALVTEVGRRNTNRTRQLLDEFEQLVKEQSIFYSG
jgi:DNA-binding MurR/RpiR family transcriptional regulator